MSGEQELFAPPGHVTEKKRNCSTTVNRELSQVAAGDISFSDLYSNLVKDIKVSERIELTEAEKDELIMNENDVVNRYFGGNVAQFRKIVTRTWFKDDMQLIQDACLESFGSLWRTPLREIFSEEEIASSRQIGGIVSGNKTLERLWSRACKFDQLRDFTDEYDSLVFLIMGRLKNVLRLLFGWPFFEALCCLMRKNDNTDEMLQRRSRHFSDLLLRDKSPWYSVYRHFLILMVASGTCTRSVLSQIFANCVLDSESKPIWSYDSSFLVALQLSVTDGEVKMSFVPRCDRSDEGMKVVFQGGSFGCGLGFHISPRYSPVRFDNPMLGCLWCSRFCDLVREGWICGYVKNHVLSLSEIFVYTMLEALGVGQRCVYLIDGRFAESFNVLVDDRSREIVKLFGNERFSDLKWRLEAQMLVKIFGLKEANKKDYCYWRRSCDCLKGIPFFVPTASELTPIPDDLNDFWHWLHSNCYEMANVDDISEALGSILERMKGRLAEVSVPRLRVFVYPSSEESLRETLMRDESESCCIEEAMKSTCEQIENLFFRRRMGSRSVGDLFGFDDCEMIMKGLEEGKEMSELGVGDDVDFSGVAAVREMRMVGLHIVSRLKCFVSMLELLVKESRVKDLPRPRIVRVD
jgi:hypothetical protein